MHYVVNATSPTATEPLLSEIPVVHEALEFDAFNRVFSPNIVTQDEAAWVGQGPLSDRTKEHLVTSDKGVILYHNLLLENVEKVKEYIVELSNHTRNHGDVYLGASPRGSLALFRTAQARAAMQGRDYVLPDDVKALAVPGLAHRVILGPAARLRDLTSDSVVQEILKKVPVPGGDLSRKQ